MFKRGFVLLATIALSLVLLVPDGASADGDEVVAAGFVGQLPASGVALALWDGGSVDEIATTDPDVTSVWVSVSGSLIGYLVGAPAFANAGFLGLYPGGAVPANTSMVVVIEPPKVGIGPVTSVEALGGAGFDAPIEFGAYGSRLFVADQKGVVSLFNANGSGESTMLDIRDRVVYGGEQGLLSVTFDSSGNLWAYYSASGPRRTVLSRFSVSGGVASASSELVVLEVDQPFSNHNGGAVRFGNDGMLYLGIGDGGSGGDPQGNGQNMMTLLGKVIRIDVSSASTGQPYVVPSNNPWVDTDGALPEIWALGLRNPWRMAFDSATGALWVGDVGQNAVEEVSVVSRGGNYGWNTMEGNACYSPSSGCSSGGLALPWATYSHSSGRCSITGGVVYRGSAVPELAGAYVFGDYCSGEVWAMPADGSAAPVVVANGLGNISSFGMDAAGEVYVVRFGRSIVRLVSP
ncbi:MAG: glucose sorbosone dehydrogenase [Dehalococcoidia bacterium]|jgi:glucose/arabinose dehydrogenase|nr:glucose sorbosone dehydrogenase [Dehalococcoidia bacterium]